MKKYEKFHGRNPNSHHRCQWQACNQKGEFKAPGEGQQDESTLWFCLEHIREYNAQWNFFRANGIDDINAFRQADAGWHRPTWPLGSRLGAKAHFVDQHDILGGGNGAVTEKGPLNRPLTGPDRKALETLGLDADARVSDIRKRYRALIKKFHPDADGGSNKSDQMLRDVIEAFNQLQDGFT